MVQEPSFFTLAGHDVRRLKSRSVAVIDSLSAAASNRKLERIGIVVLRSTTPWVAVSSFNRSFLLTLISIVVPTSVPTAEGIICGPLLYQMLLCVERRTDPIATLKGIYCRIQQSTSKSGSATANS